MLRAILNKSWRKHPTNQLLYGYLQPITKTIQVRRTRHTGHCWRSRNELICDALLWTPSNRWAKTGRLARTYIQQFYVDTGCSLMTCRKWWTIEKGGGKLTEISVLIAQHDDHDDDYPALWEYIICLFLFNADHNYIIPSGLALIKDVLINVEQFSCASGSFTACFLFFKEQPIACLWEINISHCLCRLYLSYYS